MDLTLWYDLCYAAAVHPRSSRTVILMLMHSHYPVCLRGTLLRCPVRPRVIIMVYSSCFPSRTVMMMTSYCIVVPLVLHSWSPWTLLIILDNDLIMTWWFLLLPIMDYEYLRCHLYRWLLLNDAWMMLWWFLLLPPIMDSTYRTCQLCRSLLHDVVVMSSSTSLLTLSSFAVPPGDVVVVAVLICSLCAPVQLRADEYLLYRWWVSRLQPL